MSSSGPPNTEYTYIINANVSKCIMIVIIYILWWWLKELSNEPSRPDRFIWWLRECAKVFHWICVLYVELWLLNMHLREMFTNENESKRKFEMTFSDTRIRVRDTCLRMSSLCCIHCNENNTNGQLLFSQIIIFLCLCYFFSLSFNISNFKREKF